MKHVRLHIVLAVVSALALTACGEDNSGRSQTQPPMVSVAQPAVETIVDWDDYVGQFEAVQRVNVRPRVSGYIVDIHFEDGQMVEKGEPLFTIDPRPFEARLAEAKSRVAEVEARLANLRTQLTRQRKLIDVQAVSEEELEALESRVKSAEAELQAAKAAVWTEELNVEFTTVKSPIDGQVSERQVDVGNAVNADSTILTTLVSLDPIHFAFEGSEALYLKYKRQKRADSDQAVPVRIRLQDETAYKWEGRLDFMDTMVDAGTGTIQGRAVVDNPDGFLIPGMFGQMQLQASDPYKGIMVPDTAVATQGGQRIVYIVDSDNTVVAKTVKLGPLKGDLRVIRSGLSSDDRVIVGGQQRVRPGQTVRIEKTMIDVPKELASLPLATE